MEKTYIFGYGSLVIPHGINHRGMKYNYSGKDLHEAKLVGFKREWNAISKVGVRYLGVVNNDNSNCVNGVIFEVHSLNDLEAFKKSEEIPVTYTLDDVTEKVETTFKIEGKVFTCVTCKPSGLGEVSRYYYNFICSAIRDRGEKFEREFRETTQMDFEKL